jgi:hypothetical protein
MKELPTADFIFIDLETIDGGARWRIPDGIRPSKNCLSIMQVQG